MKESIDPYSGTPFDLTGKTVLVSGAGGLLGREFCLALASAGANLFIADIDEKKMKETALIVSQTNQENRVQYQVIDITSRNSIQQCVDKAEKEFGTIDVLVNSAAIDPKFDKNSDTSTYSSFAAFPETLWSQSIEVNLTGAFLLTQCVCQVMEAKGKGSIIHLGSNYGLVGPDQRIYKKNGEEKQSFKPVVYSVCKAGLLGFTKYLAAYYAGTEIRVNLLTPSGVYNAQEEEFVRNYAERTILRRMSKKNEYWGAVLFLASEASSYMTGGNLVVDGGWTAL
jgi:NAD(P)-dependent dehydrogenase (short-subunit alcohol dehydrogenase family)